MYFRRWYIGCVVLVVTACLASTDAEARRGIVLINHGDAIKEIGSVSDEHRQAIIDEIGVTPQVGFIHQRFGLFYLDLWTWDGRYCMFSGEQYWELNPEQAAELLGLSVADLQTPLLYRMPPGLGIAVLVVAIFAAVKIRERSKMKQLRGLFDDARYQRALDFIKKRTEASPDTTDEEPVASDAFQKGVDDAVAYLTGEGVSDSEARANLQSMMQVIAAAQQHSEAQASA